MPRPCKVWLLLLILAGSLPPALAEPYTWSATTPAAVLAPSDRRVAGEIRGAALQGGLLDLRYGQASIRARGVGHLLEWDGDTAFTLNGAPTTPETLVGLVEGGTGLTVAVRYDPESGRIGWFDAVSAEPVPALSARLDPFKEPLVPGELLTVAVSQSEIDRLNLRTPTLMVPGTVHDLPLYQRNGAWRAEVPIMPGWNWKNLPLFVRGESGTAFRGRTISVSSSGPELGEAGPQIASACLTSIPGWVDLEGNTDFLDPLATRITASAGARVVEIVPRAGRISFRLEVDGPGSYVVRAEVRDLAGRGSQKEWHLTVRP